MSKCIAPAKYRLDQGYSPCGKCDPCLKNKRSQWQFRLKIPFQIYGVGSMITLTYHDKYLPMSHKIKPFGVVSKPDIDKFKKRFKTQYKRTYGHNPIFIHYGIAEYSPEKLRPHYHIFTVGDDPQRVEKIAKSTWSFGHVNVDSIKKLDDKSTARSLGARASYVIGHNFKEDSYIDKLSKNHTRPFTVKSRGIGFDILNYLASRFNKHSMIPIMGFSRYERWLLTNHDAFHGLDLKFSEWSGLIKTCSETNSHMIDVHSKLDDPPKTTGLHSPNLKGIVSFITPYMIRKISKLIDPHLVNTLEYIKNNEPIPLHYADVIESHIKESTAEYNDYIGSDDHIHSKNSIAKYLRLRKNKRDSKPVRRLK